ncbi:uncharacterized protein BJ171DRAFT_494188 [Polychytrium aggregatum]|uniref:uncharacterized protein n=1 Tax=Polychytrium aggregatum TaxID=110093 RepID=UPI0022FE6D13|nr:uncharacterized protein BJ171DRAFT_494188 [Polychytrium aggregatum]KAI9207299.1 hypothetical protein BJ171DRAFT_494188 [Polychytrium aggregatum]
MHFIGLGVPQKDVDALDYWQEVSTKSTNTMHKPIATHMLGWMHYLGRGTQRDEPKGVKLIRSNKSDEFPLGEENSLAAYGLTCSEELAACKFFELCRLGSDQEWLCRHLMAVCLVQGFGTGKVQKKAAGIFAQLAAQNHGDSQHWLGTCHLCGWGAPKDESKSFQWYSSSASQDNSYGHYRLGGCYFRGWGVAQSQTMALKSFRKSVEHGNRYGQYQMGFCHQFGIAASKNIGTAIFWYRKSAQQGNDYAVKRLEKLGK